MHMVWSASAAFGDSPAMPITYMLSVGGSPRTHTRKTGTDAGRQGRRSLSQRAWSATNFMLRVSIFHVRPYLGCCNLCSRTGRRKTEGSWAGSGGRGGASRTSGQRPSRSDVLRL